MGGQCPSCCTAADENKHELNDNNDGKIPAPVYQITTTGGIMRTEVVRLPDKKWWSNNTEVSTNLVVCQ